MVKKENFLNEIKVHYEPSPSPIKKRKLKCAKDVIKILKVIYDLERITHQEQAVILLVNSSNNLIGYYRLSSGGLSSTIIDPRLVFSIALKSLATAIIISHNHPSGQLFPSVNDELITMKMKEVGKLLDIKLLDHLIVNPDFDYYSFSDQGLL